MPLSPSPSAVPRTAGLAAAPPAGAAPVPGYNLAAPTEQDALLALARLVGPDKAKATWAAACAAAGVPRLGMSVAQLQLAAQQLAQQPGIVSVTGNSLMVRLISYQKLLRKKELP